MKKIALALMLASTISADAISDERAEEWYRTVDGKFSVMSSEDPNVFATLAWSKSGDARVYIQSYQPDHCIKHGDRALANDPLYINNTLVKYGKQCNGEWNYFHAESEAGADYVLDQFRTKTSVKLREPSGHELTFSAIGFIDSYNTFIQFSKAL